MTSNCYTNFCNFEPKLRDDLPWTVGSDPYFVNPPKFLVAAAKGAKFQIFEKGAFPDKTELAVYGNNQANNINLNTLKNEFNARNISFVPGNKNINTRLLENEAYFVFDGEGGNDNLVGSTQADVIAGGADNDKIDGGRGDDLLLGDGDVFDFQNEKVKDGNDTITGGDGNDDIDGGGGDDIITGDAGKDDILGGAGNDKIDGGEGDDVVDGEEGNDTINGGAGDDKLKGGSGNDAIKGGDGDDVICGGADDDVLSGEKGNDTVLGNDGNDKLFGNAGDDLLIGGKGNDTMTGGTGDDVFGYQPKVDGKFIGRDVITDFNYDIIFDPEFDQIDLSCYTRSSSAGQYDLDIINVLLQNNGAVLQLYDRVGNNGAPDSNDIFLGSIVIQGEGPADLFAQAPTYGSGEQSVVRTFADVYEDGVFIT